MEVRAHEAVAELHRERQYLASTVQHHPNANEYLQRLQQRGQRALFKRRQEKTFQRMQLHKGDATEYKHPVHKGTKLGRIFSDAAFS